jgi:hypothetical protein
VPMLEEDQIQKIRLVLTSSGWNDVMRPAILNRGNQALRQLCLSPSERPGKETDEHLRATIQTCEWMAACWSNEIVLFEGNRLNELQRNGSTAANP